MTTYAYVTFAQAKDRLASLLGDPAKVFWSDTELGLYLIEALRAWGLHAQYWRETVTVNTAVDQAFYDIQTQALDDTGTPVQGTSVGVRNLITETLYHLLENQITSWPGGWVGTEMFGLAEIAELLTRSRDTYRMDTSQLIGRVDIEVGADTPRVVTSDDIIRIRRAVWQPDDGEEQVLWLIDQAQAQATSPSAVWPESGDPKAYAVNYTPNLSIDLWPKPSTNGTLKLLVCRTSLNFNPTVSNATVGVPDDAAHLLKYRAMADLFSGDGLARAPQMAQYCQDRWQAGITAVRRYHSVLWTTLEGVRVAVSSLAQRDIMKPDWASTSGAPTAAALPAWNMLVLSPVPDAIYAVTLEMVRRAPVPSDDMDYLQIGREHMLHIYGYAQHIACLKQQGAEFEMTFPMLEEFFQAAEIVRAQQAAETPTYWELERLGRREEQWRPIWRQQPAATAAQEALTT